MRRIMIFLSVLFLTIPVCVFAQEDAKTSPEPKDTVRFGSEIKITDPSPRDVIVAGGSIEISGDVEKNVLVAGAVVHIVGNTLGDVMVIGGRIIIDGSVGGNATLVGGEVVVGKDSQIGGDLYVISSSLKIDGKIKGGLQAKTNQFDLGGEISKDVNLSIYNSDKIALGPSSSVGGSFSYKSLDENSDIDKSKISKDLKYEKVIQKQSFLDQLGRLTNIISLFGMLVVGLVFSSLLPKTLRRAVGSSVRMPHIDFIWGAVALVAVPLVAIFLSLTIIGIPLALVLFAFYIVAIYIGHVFVGIVLGTYIFGAIGGRQRAQKASIIFVMVSGVVVYWLITGIPKVGLIFEFVGAIWGLGIIVRINLKAFNLIEKS